MAAICVDAGTTLIKAVAYDEAGNEIAVARQPTEVHRPRPGYSEQDMQAVWNAAVFAIRSVQSQIGDEVQFIALTGQGDGCWLVDGDGQPTGPAILWNDGRAKEIVERWNREGAAGQAYQLNGSQIFSGLPNAILSWLRKEDPARLKRSKKALYCDGWIYAQLTGKMAADDSDASAPFLDIRRREYSSEILKLYGMEWARDLLPDLRTGEGRLAALTPAAAAQLGMRAGLPVIMAQYDVAAMAIGAGAIKPGQACSVLGTTICTEAVRAEVDTERRPAGLTLCYVGPGLYLDAFPTLAGAEVFGWAQKIMDIEHPRELGELASRVEMGANNLVFLPYLSPSGERTPFFDAAARGSLFGLSFQHGRPHVARAILEGLSMVIRDCLEAAAASPDELHLCGGGAKDEFWCQMIADVTGLRSSCSIDHEVGAKGAFITGMVITGEAQSYEQAVKDFVRVGATYEPERERSLRYRELYACFRDLREIAVEAWRRMAQV